MKITLSAQSLFRLAVFGLVSIGLFGIATCDAQWGLNRGTSWGSQGRGGFRYRGPLMSLEIASPYSAFGPAPAFGIAPAFGPTPAFGIGALPPSPYGYGINGGLNASSLDRYRGLQPTQAEIDREAFYYNLDRTHRFQTREERYGNDFAARYTPPAAMVNRYQYPYVAGAPAGPPLPQRVPGLTLNRYESRYQGYVADDDVAVALRAAAMRLTMSLARMSDGHIWIKHLKPDFIIESIDQVQPPSLLSDLIINYEGVAENPRLVLISSAEGFADVRRLIAQYVTLSSTYPQAEASVSEPWMGASSYDQETILSERVIGETELVDPNNAQFPQPLDTSDSTYLPPSMKPSDAMPLQNPRLNDFPDTADVELLPPPVASPAD